jgi:uncharacterized protein
MATKLLSAAMALALLASTSPAFAGDGDDCPRPGDVSYGSRLTKAVEACRRLADQGEPYAQYDMGVIYNDGIGGVASDSEALKWFRKAADQGYDYGQNRMGLIHAGGQNGVTQDYGEGLVWFGKAAQQGLAEAQYNLGVLYQEGHGVPQNFAEALKWYRMAANQGYDRAQLSLGFMYANGIGVKKDSVQAYMWFNLAAASNATYAPNRDQTAKLLTPDQLAKAQKLALDWKPTAP